MVCIELQQLVLLAEVIKVGWRREAERGTLGREGADGRGGATRRGSDGEVELRG